MLYQQSLKLLLALLLSTVVCVLKSSLDLCSQWRIREFVRETPLPLRLLPGSACASVFTDETSARVHQLLVVILTQRNGEPIYIAL